MIIYFENLNSLTVVIPFLFLKVLFCWVLNSTVSADEVFDAMSAKKISPSLVLDVVACAGVGGSGPGIRQTPGSSARYKTFFFAFFRCQNPGRSAR